MKDSVRKLAADFKQFLTTREEDELISAASTKAAVPHSQSNTVSAVKETAVSPSAPEDHLTVSFRRKPAADKPQPAPVAAAVSQSQPIPAVAADLKEKIPMSADNKQTLLDEIAAEIEKCRRCPLGATRLHAVPGEGNPHAKLMFIGEGPGFDEDHKGRPFIGRAGQLLDKMIAAMKTEVSSYINDVIKVTTTNFDKTPSKYTNDRLDINILSTSTQEGV